MTCCRKSKIAISKSRRVPMMPDSTCPPVGRVESGASEGTSPKRKRQPAREKPIELLSDSVPIEKITFSPSILNMVQKPANHTSGDCTDTLREDCSSNQPRNNKNASSSKSGLCEAMFLRFRGYDVYRSHSPCLSRGCGRKISLGRHCG